MSDDLIFKKGDKVEVHFLGAWSKGVVTETSAAYKSYKVKFNSGMSYLEEWFNQSKVRKG